MASVIGILLLILLLIRVLIRTRKKEEKAGIQGMISPCSI